MEIFDFGNSTILLKFKAKSFSHKTNMALREKLLLYVIYANPAENKTLLSYNLIHSKCIT